MINMQKRLSSIPFLADGFIMTHYNPDADSIFSLWIIYKFLDNTINITIDEFIEKIVFTSSATLPEFPDFGVDINDGCGDNHIKEGDFPISINGRIFSHPCASMTLASLLLCERDFRAIKDVIADIHTVDTGRNTPNKNNNPNLVTLWGIIAAMQDSQMEFKTLFKVVDSIFASLLSHSSNAREVSMLKLNDVISSRIDGQVVVITPINSGRQLSEKCFHELFANVVIWSSYDERTRMGTVGISVSKKFSIKYDLRSLVNYAGIKAISLEVGDLFIAPHIVGRTTKSPILETTEDKITGYAEIMRREIVELIKRGS